MKVFLMALILAIGFYSCNQARIRQLQKRVSELETQLDECKNGGPKLLSQLKTAFEQQEFETVKDIFLNLQTRYPGSGEFEEALFYYDSVLSFQEELQKKAAQERLERLKALDRLTKEYDDVSGVTWYRQSYFTHYNNSNLVSIYMGMESSVPWLRLRMSYEGDDWIFFEHAFLSYDGNTKEILFDQYRNKETEVGSGGVWEWIDASVSPELGVFLRDFAKSENAKMRLKGKYERTRKLTDNERKGILDILNGYDALKSNLK